MNQVTTEGPKTLVSNVKKKKKTSSAWDLFTPGSEDGSYAIIIFQQYVTMQVINPADDKQRGVESHRACVSIHI